MSNRRLQMPSGLPLWVYVGKSKFRIFPRLSCQFAVRTNFNPRRLPPEDSTAPLHAEKVFHYIYAVLHSPAYGSATPRFCAPTSRASPFPAAERCSTH
ncbi:MAG: hypothetical protein IPJ18_08540 [Betaproteobacteria bacterium]|nr:hypothetical protein [Betaproteobacteria bacterium]